jgi:hypothetical protein
MGRVVGSTVLAAVCALAASVALLSNGCGGDDPGLPPGGGGGDAGPEPDGGGGGTPDASVDPDGPSVAIVSPTAPGAGDYSSDAILVDGRVTATCRVTRNESTGDPVDSASVVLSAAGEGGATAEVAGTPNGTADEWSGTLDLGGFPNGQVTVTCSASDLADPPRTNSDQVATFLDLGPDIAVLSPAEGAAYGSQVDISFQVSEAPVADGDDGAAIDEVSARVGAVELELTPTGGGSYFTTLVFDDDAFVPPLDGPVAVTITASNSRSPAAVTRTIELSFVADSDGPDIELEKPEPAELVSGFMTIRANVTDSAGIETVLARVANDYEIELLHTNADIYQASFDTRQLSRSWVFPLVEVIARDLVGNESAIGRVVALDNRAPLVTLDSPPMREGICLTPNVCEPTDPRMCSRLFDPLGDDAVDDGEKVGALLELRVRAEDLGNGALAPSGVYIPLAGVDPAAVDIFVLDDSDMALIVDTDGDGVCDALNPIIEPVTVPTSSTEAAVISAAAVAPQGNSWFVSSAEPYGSTPGIDDDICVTPEPQDLTPPETLCTSSPMTRAISAETGQGGTTAAVFTIPPVGGPQCTGNAFDAPATNISDGWACAVAFAADSLGNEGLSAPLRFCVDHDGDGLDDDGVSLTSLGCAAAFGNVAAPGNRPACTDGCSLPLSFRNIPSMQLRVIRNEVPDCSDGVDNDNDSDVDWPDDTGCTSADDPLETN